MTETWILEGRMRQDMQDMSRYGYSIVACDNCCETIYIKEKLLTYIFNEISEGLFFLDTVLDCECVTPETEFANSEAFGRTNDESNFQYINIESRRFDSITKTLNNPLNRGRNRKPRELKEVEYNRIVLGLV